MGLQQKLCIGTCPICDRAYTLENNVTKHHIFPRYWYGPKGTVRNLRWKVTVIACHECHEVEFNGMFPMHLRYPWLVSICLQNWVKFCEIKGKNAFLIYPQLTKLEPML